MAKEKSPKINSDPISIIVTAITNSIRITKQANIDYELLRESKMSVKRNIHSLPMVPFIRICFYFHSKYLYMNCVSSKTWPLSHTQHCAAYSTANKQKKNRKTLAHHSFVRAFGSFSSFTVWRALLQSTFTLRLEFSRSLASKCFEHNVIDDGRCA